MEHISEIVDDVMEQLAARMRWQREATDIRRHTATLPELPDWPNPFGPDHREEDGE